MKPNFERMKKQITEMIDTYISDSRELGFEDDSKIYDVLSDSFTDEELIYYGFENIITPDND